MDRLARSRGIPEADLMIRVRWFGLMALIGIGFLSTGNVSPAWSAPAKGKVAATTKAPPSISKGIKPVPEGFRLGMTVAEVEAFYDRVLDQDYVPRYKKASVGPQMKALDAALADQKAGFRRSKVEFGNLPTGIDNTPLKGEYNYKNGEMMMSLVRSGATRYFFFAQNRLWKFYDVLALGQPGQGDEGAAMGLNMWCEDDCGKWTTFKGVAEFWKEEFGVAGRLLQADPAQQRNYNEMDWMDGSTHIRLLDRSDEKVVALVFEDRSTSDRMAAFRAAHKSSEDAIDPTILSVTRPGAAIDPNERAADAYTGRTHAGPPAPSPAKKK